MGFQVFKRQEVGFPVPNEVYNLRIYLAAIAASFAACIIGYDAGFIGGTVALDSFRGEFGFSSMSASEQTLISANIVSVFQAGAFFGSLFMYPIGETFGRKIGLLIAGFFLTFGAAISLISNEDRGLGAIYAGRVLTGLGVGAASGMAPIYVSEIAPPSIRGQLVGMFEIAWQVGGVVGYWINYGVLKNVPDGREQWMIPFAIQLIPSGIFWFGTFFLPESPRWLLANNNATRAHKNLSYLRKVPVEHPYFLYEIAHIELAIEEQKLGGDGGFWMQIKRTFSHKKYIYRLIRSTGLFPMQNSSGINAVTYYSPTVFKSLGISGTSTGLLSTGIFGLTKACSSLIWMLFVVDSAGRRSSLFWGSFPCAICMYYLGAYVKLSDPAGRLASGNTSIDAGGRAALAMFYIWSFCFGLSWNGNCWVYNSEIFDQSVRTFVQACNASSNWFWAFIMGRFTGQMFAAMGYGVYFLFAGCMTVFPWVIFCFYPETKGVPLEAIDYLFDKGVPAWRARKHALEKLAGEDRNLHLVDDEKQTGEVQYIEDYPDTGDVEK